MDSCSRFPADLEKTNATVHAAGGVVLMRRGEALLATKSGLAAPLLLQLAQSEASERMREREAKNAERSAQQAAQRAEKAAKAAAEAGAKAASA